MSGQPVSQNARIAAERLAFAMGLPLLAEKIVSGEANHSAIVQAFTRFETDTIERLTAAQVDVERMRGGACRARRFAPPTDSIGAHRD